MSDAPDVTIRPLDPAAADELAHVAARMQATLVEVLGAEQARAQHTPDEILDRVRWHLERGDGRRAEALVAVDAADGLVGHTLLRVEPDDAGDVGDAGDAGDAVDAVDAGAGGDAGDASGEGTAGEFGLFATIWVEPGRRRDGLASRLIHAGEAWMRAQGQGRARTWTDRDNTPLIRLFEARGYTASHAVDGWTILSREL